MEYTEEDMVKATRIGDAIFNALEKINAVGDDKDIVFIALGMVAGSLAANAGAPESRINTMRAFAWLALDKLGK